MSKVASKVASPVVSESRVQLSSVASPSRPRAFQSATESAEIVAFPLASQVASLSEVNSWQSVGDAASLVLRKLRPTPVLSLPVASRVAE